MKAPFWRRRLLPVVLALLAANLVALAAWTGPRTWRQRNAAFRIEAARAEVERLSAQAAALRQRAETVRTNLSDVERFYRSLAGSEKTDLLPALEAIEDLARAPGLTPGGRSVRREEVPGASLERVAVNLPLEGSYAQLVGFLGELERSPRFVTLDRVSMRGDERQGTSLVVELSAYLRQPPEARKEKRRGRA